MGKAEGPSDCSQGDRWGLYSLHNLLGNPQHTYGLAQSPFESDSCLGTASEVSAISTSRLQPRLTPSSAASVACKDGLLCAQ